MAFVSDDSVRPTLARLPRLKLVRVVGGDGTPDHGGAAPLPLLKVACGELGAVPVGDVGAVAAVLGFCACSASDKRNSTNRFEKD